MATNDYLRQAPRVAIRHVRPEDCEEMTGLIRDSAEMFHRWFGVRETTREAFERYIEMSEHPAREAYVICLRDTGAIVGSANINHIIRGAMQSGSLGYTAYASTTGHGYMTEGVALVLEHAFEQLGLHRLEANIQPENTASINLAQRLGFRREGYSPAFQLVNGEWMDHERWAVTATAPAQ